MHYMQDKHKAARLGQQVLRDQAVVPPALPAHKEPKALLALQVQQVLVLQVPKAQRGQQVLALQVRKAYRATQAHKVQQAQAQQELRGQLVQVVAQQALRARKVWQAILGHKAQPGQQVQA